MDYSGGRNRQRILRRLEEAARRLTTTDAVPWVTAYAYPRGRPSSLAPGETKGLLQAHVIAAGDGDDMLLLFWRDQDASEVARGRTHPPPGAHLQWEGRLADVASLKRPWWKPQSPADILTKLAAAIGAFAIVYNASQVLTAEAKVRPEVSPTTINALAGKPFEATVTVTNERQDIDATVALAPLSDKLTPPDPAKILLGPGDTGTFHVRGTLPTAGPETVRLETRASSDWAHLRTTTSPVALRVMAWKKYEVSLTTPTRAPTGKLCEISGTVRTGQSFVGGQCVAQYIGTLPIRFHAVTSETLLEQDAPEWNEDAPKRVEQISWSVRSLAAFPDPPPRLTLYIVPTEATVLSDGDCARLRDEVTVNCTLH